MKNSSDLTIRCSEKSIFPILTTESYIQPKASHLKGVPSYCRHQRFVYLLQNVLVMVVYCTLFCQNCLNCAFLPHISALYALMMAINMTLGKEY